MTKMIITFILRLLTNSIALYLCIKWFATSAPEQITFSLALGAGLIFSLVNTFIKPLASIASLPLTILTMGLFQIIINAAMVSFSFWIVNLGIDFWGAILSSIVIAIINFLANLIIIPYNKK